MISYATYEKEYDWHDRHCRNFLVRASIRGDTVKEYCALCGAKIIERRPKPVRGSGNLLPIDEYLIRSRFLSSDEVAQK